MHSKCHRGEYNEGQGTSIFSRFATKVTINTMSTRGEKRKRPKWSKQANWSSMNLGGPCPMSCSTATTQSFIELNKGKGKNSFSYIELNSREKIGK